MSAPSTAIPAAADPAIVIDRLTKTYGSTVAVDDLSIRIPAGRVTGFLGPNGAGKTTTMRCLLGLAAPTRGACTILGRPYRDLDDPVRTVGALVDGASFHPGRSGRTSLEIVALASRLPASRVDEVLAMVGLTDAAGRSVGGYSLGMKQRLGLAAALLGDPRVLVLDEPANGLDPEGVRWIREFLRYLADEGRTVFVSSHVLGEVSRLADDVVVIRDGRLVAHAPVSELTVDGSSAFVRTPDASTLEAMLSARGFAVTHQDGALLVHGTGPEVIGELAAAEGIVLHELRRHELDLESAFLELTGTNDAEEVTA